MANSLRSRATPRRRASCSAGSTGSPTASASSPSPRRRGLGAAPQRPSLSAAVSASPSSTMPARRVARPTRSRSQLRPRLDRRRPQSDAPPRRTRRRLPSRLRRCRLRRRQPAPRRAVAELQALQRARRFRLGAADGVWTSASDVARDEITATVPETRRRRRSRPATRARTATACGRGHDRPAASARPLPPRGDRRDHRQDASVPFVTGSTTAAIRNPEPNLLEVASDARRYDAGATATLQVYAPFDGEVLVAIADDEIQEWVSGSTTDRVATIKVPIRARMGGQGALRADHGLPPRDRRHRAARAGAGDRHDLFRGRRRRANYFDLAIRPPLQAKPGKSRQGRGLRQRAGVLPRPISTRRLRALYAVDEGWSA